MAADSTTSAAEAKVVALPQAISVDEKQTRAEVTPAPSAAATHDRSDQAISPKSMPDAEDEHLNTDNRAALDWKGHYPEEAKREIHYEARVVAGILFLTFAGLLLTWRGTAFELLSGECGTCSREAFDRYAYFYLGGQLGGILFGVKYLYKVVARGRWHLDRRLWRFFSPFLSGGLAFVVGALTDSGVMGLTVKASSGSAYFSLGFIAGYFADSALAKMQEIADTVFGSPSKRHPPPAQTKSEQAQP